MKKIFYLYVVLFSLMVWSQQGEEALSYVPIIATGIEYETTEPPVVAPTSVSEEASFDSSYYYNSYAAGNTAGHAGVNATGAFTYEVPISVPPGVRDVQPNISLQFNSQGGNGLAGWGWNLSGLSTISRIPSTLHHDGVQDGIDFDELDRYALDGQRLILSSGSYGKANATYTTENYSHLKVKAHGTHPYGADYGPQYFVVYYPDGSRAYYGNKTNSYNRLEWVITEWTDVRGNRVEYFYTYDKNWGNLLQLDRITYGKSNLNTPINEVLFNYKDRDHWEVSFVGGHYYHRDNILSEIVVKNHGATYRKYQLTHETTNMGYQRVSQVQEFNGKGEKMAPIVFRYQNDKDTSSISSSNMTTPLNEEIDNENSSILTGNLNQDANLDFVVYNKHSRNRLHIYTRGFDSKVEDSTQIARSVYLSKFDDVITATVTNKKGALDSFQRLVTVSESIDNHRSKVVFKIFDEAPIDKEDVFGVDYSKEWNASVNTRQQCETVDDDSLEDDWSTDVNITRKSYKIPKNYISGDFDGNGITDVIAIQESYKGTSCSLNNIDCSDDIMLDQERGNIRDDNSNYRQNNNCCSCRSYTISGGLSYFIDLSRSKASNFVTNIERIEDYSSEDRLLVADFNGDGKSDIWHIKDKNLHIYSLVNNRLTKIASEEDNSWIRDFLPILLGDYNGDGKTDFIIPKAEDGGDRWYYFRSTGNGFSSRAFENFHDFNIPNSEENTIQYIPQDVNQDGKTDILIHEIASGSRVIRSGSPRTGFKFERVVFFTRDKLKVLLNQGSTLFKIADEYDYSSGEISDDPTKIIKHPIPVFAGINTHNKKMQYAVLSRSLIKRYEIQTPHRSNMQLRQVANKGLFTNISYSSLDGIENPSVYQSDHGMQYPYVHINHAPGMDLVSQITETANGHTRFQKFKYKGAVSHVGGLGFMGFTHMARSNIYGDGVGALWNISRHDPLLRGAATEQWLSETYDFDSDCYINKTVTEYHTVLDDNNIFINVPKQIATHNNLTHTLHEHFLTYNAFYNLEREREKTDDFEKITSYTYFNNPNSWSQHYYIGRPKSVKTSTSVTEAKDFATETQYTYHSNLLKTEKQRANGSSWLTTTYTRDSYGNILTKEVSGSGFDKRTEQFSYSTDGRDLLTYTDILGLETSYEYDPIGTLKKETNPYGQRTQYAYDGWQRLVQETNYLGRVTTISYQNRSGGGYIKKVDYPNTAPDQITYYSAYGWVDEVHTQVLTSDQWSKQYFQYDVAGRKRKESLPDFNSAKKWSYTDYDIYGRISQLREATGRVITTLYDGKRTQIDDGYKTASTTKNALDQIVELTDPGGTIHYSYHANGVLRAADYGGYVVRTDIDQWGRKESLDDPTAGVYTYDYNDLGELLEETTPKGSTTYTYDLGRVATKTSEGDLTDTHTRYRYDTTTQLLNEVITEDYHNDHTSKVTYQYDGYKRISSITEDRGDARFSRELTYDDYGRVYQEHLEAQDKNSLTNHTTTTRYGYSTTGAPNKIYEGVENHAYWELKEKNAFGQQTAAFLEQSDYTVHWNYDAYGYLNGIHDDEQTIDEKLLDLEYRFDVRRGLLLERSDKLLSVESQRFEYDSMDRLVSAHADTHGHARTRHRSYDPRGRVLEDSRMGINMHYGSGDALYRIQKAELNPVGLAYYQQHPERQISYNIDRKPVELHDVGNGRMSLAYDTDGHRYAAWYGGEDPDRADRRYHKSYSRIAPIEIVRDQEAGTVKFLTYVGGDAYTAPMVHVKDTDASKPSGYHHLHRDYLGSILAVSDENGEVTERAHFDAWGEVAVFQKDGQEASIADSLTGRGFTGHEHFEEVGLIHMNGRMYDAQQGRFLSPDSHIQDPFNTQNYNRYGYVLNNPLTLTDPSGEFFWVAVAIGAFFGGATAAIQGGDFGDIFLGALIGGIAAGIGAGLSNVVAQSLGVVGSSAGFFGNAALSASGFWTSAAVGAAGGFAAGFVGAASNAWVKGASFSQGIKAGLKAGAIAGASAGLIGGVSGGLRASKNGGNFWSGKRPQVETVSTLNPTGIQDVSGHIKPSGNLEGLQTIDSGLLDSPTGFGLRNDTGGLGHYGAPRGNRLHTGLDFKSIDGQNITSPIDGTVINRIGDSGPLVDIYPNNPNIGFDRMQILYVDSPPNILSDVTRNINAGDVIGNSLNLQSLGYPTSVGPHVHLQLWKDGIKINPTKFFFK